LVTAASDRQRRIEIGRERRLRTRARIIEAAFSLFGEEDGLYTRIEDIADRAGITRPTFYNHFSGMAELRDAVTYEVTHDFLTAVTRTIADLADPRERASAAIRFYLERARQDLEWGRSIINLSANGILFGAETHQQASLTVQEGMADGKFHVPSASIGRDIVLGISLAAITTIVREDPGEAYPALMVRSILVGLGVASDEADRIVRRPLPLLSSPD
jgi:AcrR family transcriptional regulator